MFLSVYLSVCLSVTSQFCIEMTAQIKLILAWRLRSSYPTLCYKDMWVSQKITYFPLELCPKLWI